MTVTYVAHLPGHDIYRAIVGSPVRSAPNVLAIRPKNGRMIVRIPLNDVVKVEVN